MKRKNLLLLAILSIIGIFTSCGKKEEQAKKESIVVWEQMEPTGRTEFMNIVEDFKAENPDIDVTVTHYAVEDLRTQFQNAALAGQGPDVVYGPDDNIGIFTISDLIEPVDDIISKDLLSTFDKDALNAGKIDGKHYSLPDMNGNQIALLYNKAMVKTAPKDFNEFLKVAQKYQAKDKSTYGFVYNEKEPFWFIGLYNGFGGRVMNDKYQPTLDNDAMVKALQFAVDVRKKYNLGIDGMDYDISSELFKQGKVAFLLNGAWSWNEYKNAGIDLGVMPMVKLPGAKDNPLFFSSTKGFSIAKDVDKDKYEALNKFFAFVFKPENNAKYTLAQAQAPAITATRQLDSVKNDELMQASISTIEKTIPMPIVAEMRAIWDGMRPSLEAVLNGNMTPEQGAKKMQEDSVKGIKTLHGE